MASLSGEKRQVNTDDYKDFLMSGKNNDAMTDKDMENVIFATGAKGAICNFQVYSYKRVCVRV